MIVDSSQCFMSGTWWTLSFSANGGFSDRSVWIATQWVVALEALQRSGGGGRPGALRALQPGAPEVPESPRDFGFLSYGPLFLGKGSTSCPEKKAGIWSRGVPQNGRAKTLRFDFGWPFFFF